METRMGRSAVPIRRPASRAGRLARLDRTDSRAACSRPARECARLRPCASLRDAVESVRRLGASVPRWQMIFVPFVPSWFCRR